MALSKLIKEALVYACSHSLVEEEDAVYLENLLLRHFSCFPPYKGEIEERKIASYPLPDPLLKALREELLKQGKSEAEIEDEGAFLLGMLTPSPSQVTSTFLDYYSRSSKAATDYLYNLGVLNHYIAKSHIDKNICYVKDFAPDPYLEITINLSKPEKNNKDIAKLLSQPKSGAEKYPLCPLCRENLGYPGINGHAPRENLRFIPLHLDGERWYLQYSPYGYFDQHCILFYEKHVPMEVSRRIFSKELAFVDLFPHFFIGSNSDLPIVGGSILNHEHFQGGLHRLPLFHCAPKREVPTPSYPSCQLEVMDFYDTVLRISSAEKEELLDLAEAILLRWEDYDDPGRGILSHTEGKRHNTATSLAEKKDGRYFLYLILRNNRCDEAYPDGIFHAHPEYFHVKKEGIGLIEAAGRFILPPRLLRQRKLIEDGIKEGKDDSAIVLENPELASFAPMMDALRGGMGWQDYYAGVCRNILQNVAVYKNDPEGEKGLGEFLTQIER